MNPEGSRIIAVSFAPQTKTTLDGFQPRFANKDSILISNGEALDTCEVKVDDKGATITTNLTGPLTAVYPYKAAKMNDSKTTQIDTVLVSTVQSGKFADANICMAKMKDESLSFENKTAVFCIKPPTNSPGYVEVSAEGFDIANYIPTGSSISDSSTIHVAPITTDSVYVSILVPDGLTVGDLKFSDGTNVKAITTGDRADEGIAAGKLYTVTNANWAPEPYVEIKAKYNGQDSTTLRWYRQNLAITGSGKKSWKGGNASAVKVPGTNEDVKVGDYFQWAAYAGYCGSASETDKGLLIYTAFNNTKCGDAGSDGFTFKSAGESKTYRFNMSDDGNNIGISPYYSNSAYSEYTSGSVNLKSSDDVASIILGDTWRMPTSAEFQAMKNATYWAWDGTDQGYYVFWPGQGTQGSAGESAAINPTTDTKADALLFFPAAGYGYNTSLFNAGSYGTYWSSSLYTFTTDCAYDLFFSSDDVDPQDDFNRYYGYSVRPVSDPEAEYAAVTGVELDITAKEIEQGNGFKLNATVSPADATQNGVYWSSSAPAVATVDALGNVKGVGAGTATITVTTVDGQKTATCTVTVSATPASIVPEGFVDLGVKNDVGEPLYWAECNLGATNAWDYGKYFSWGDVTGQTPTSNTFSKAFSWDNDVFGQTFNNEISQSEACPSGVLAQAYDAAYQTNSVWRMPTKEDFTELARQCFLEWTDNYKGTTNVKGVIVWKAKDGDAGWFKPSTAGKGCKIKDDGSGYKDSETHTFSNAYALGTDSHVFFPAAGFGQDSSFNSAGNYGIYWSSSLRMTSTKNACLLNFGSDSVYPQGYNDRRCGNSIRPVSD